MSHVAVNVLTINFRHDVSQTQHRPHTASLDFVVKTVSSKLDFNILVRFNIWTLGKSKFQNQFFYNFDIACVKKLHKEAIDNKIK